MYLNIFYSFFFVVFNLKGFTALSACSEIINVPNVYVCLFFLFVFFRLKKRREDDKFFSRDGTRTRPIGLPLDNLTEKKTSRDKAEIFLLTRLPPFVVTGHFFVFFSTTDLFFFYTLWT